MEEEICGEEYPWYHRLQAMDTEGKIKTTVIWIERKKERLRRLISEENGLVKEIHCLEKILEVSRKAENEAIDETRRSIYDRELKEAKTGGEEEEEE